MTPSFLNKQLPGMTTRQLHDPRHSYSQQLRVNTPRRTLQVYNVQESTYVELSTLERHQPWNMTLSSQCLPQRFYILHHDYNNRNATTSYWSHDKQESSRRFCNWNYIEQDRLPQTIPNFVTKFPVTQHIQNFEF